MILKDSLLKKKAVLDKISEQNKLQTDIAKAEKFDADAFGRTLDEKEKLIAEINTLDNGFQSVYDRVKEELHLHKESYSSEIAELKQLIAAITEKSMDVEAEEKRNRELIMNRKITIKKEIATARVTNRTAANYYKTMSKLNVVDAQFLDAKK
jgi:DNA gyrase/topoisomerase IV subunit A